MQLTAQLSARVRRQPGVALPHPGGATAPIVTDDEFASLMARFAPFEHQPRLAVAVSGGRDSMALTLLAANWAARHGGMLAALTVDHGLRNEAAGEARQVGRWLAARGIAHEVLQWRGPYPASGLQEAARAARYRLLSAHCRANGILHLLLGHHREDQAETVLIRQDSASGRAGLAGMAAVSELADVRLLRPLLDVTRDRLAATLVACGQSWIDDPTNEDITTARGHLRAHRQPVQQAAALALARTLSAQRVIDDRAVAELAASAVRIHPAGFALLDRDALRAADGDTVRRVTARAVMAVAGTVYPPRRERTERLVAALCDRGDWRGRTLGGCRLVAYRRQVLVCREPARTGPPIEVEPGRRTLWDGRFTAVLTKNSATEVVVGAVTAAGWRRLVSLEPSLRDTPIPPAARPTLPALWRDGEILAQPHLGYVDARLSRDGAGFSLVWSPPNAIAPALFGKVWL